MQPKITIWHHKNCTSSLKGLIFLQEHFPEIEIRNYMEDPPSVEELKTVLEKMKEPAISILRKKEQVYQDAFADKELSNEEWIKVMSENPVLIERPIVIAGDKAWLGRPFDEFSQKLLKELKP